MRERIPSFKESLTIFKPTYFKETAEPVVIGTEASKKNNSNFSDRAVYCLKNKVPSL